MSDQYALLRRLDRGGPLPLSSLSPLEKGQMKLLRDAVVSGFETVNITPAGRALLAAHRAEVRRDAIRYWITTGIALAALVKSFWPEIRVLLALLWPPAGQ